MYGGELSFKEKIFGGYYNEWRVKNFGYFGVLSFFNYDFICVLKCFVGMIFEFFIFNLIIMVIG